jgi:hypothetical protein
MKALYYDGVAAVTDDDIADAVVDLALVLAQYSHYEAATVPVVVDGAVEELTVILGPTIHLSTLTAPAAGPPIEGASAVAERIRLRAMELVEPLQQPGDGAEWMVPRP